MSKVVTFSILLLISILIGGGIYVFLETHERKEKTIHTGLFGEARTNPLYASRLFLKRMGIPAETKSSIQGLTGFPDTDTVLLIDSNRSNISPRRTNELIQWVKSGGHLIALATHNWSYRRANNEDNDEVSNESSIVEQSELSPDPLQKFLGVRTGNKINYDDLTDSERQRVDKIEEKDDDYVSDTLFKIHLNGVNKPLAMANNWYHPILIDQSLNNNRMIEVIKLRSTNFMVRKNVGDGLITLVSNLDFIQNRQIEKADHAEILWYLVHGLHTPISKPAAVWLIHSDKMPSLWDLLWRNAWMFILSLLSLFIAWLLNSTRRFGPIIPKMDDNRRSLIEHITSSGNFYWNHNNKGQLLESSRRALNQKLSRTYPGWVHLSETEQVNLIQEKCKISPDMIHRALFSPTIERAEDFTDSIRQLEVIRHAI